MVIARTLFEPLWRESLKTRFTVTGVTIVTGAPDARALSMCDITIMPGECLPGALDDSWRHSHTDSKLDKMRFSQVPVGLCLWSMTRLQSPVGCDCKSVVVCPGVIL